MDNKEFNQIHEQLILREQKRLRLEMKCLEEMGFKYTRLYDYLKDCLKRIKHEQ